MVESGDVKAVFTGHDHINDFCGELTGIHLCYAGGFGYHAYGRAGWSRRARMVVASLEKTDKGVWGAVKSIKTWKRLDDEHLTAIDAQVLFSKSPAGKHLYLVPSTLYICTYLPGKFLEDISGLLQVWLKLTSCLLETDLHIL